MKLTKEEAASRISDFKAALIVPLLILIAALIFWFINTHISGAEARVDSELRALKTADTLGSEVASLRDSLSETGRKNFDLFIGKLRSFDYDINGSEEYKEGESRHTKVTVRILTYDFGREYLAAWTDYLKSGEDTKPSDDDLTDFYESLFERIAALDEKDFIRTVDIVCIEPLDNGAWIADVKDNDELQDAIFGGMMSEIKALAAE